MARTARQWVYAIVQIKQESERKQGPLSATDIAEYINRNVDIAGGSNASEADLDREAVKFRTDWRLIRGDGPEGRGPLTMRAPFQPPRRRAGASPNCLPPSGARAYEPT